MKENTISIYIPETGGMDYLEGAINGVNFRVKTGVVAEVPKRIADVIAESRRELLTGENAVKAYSASGGRKLW
ncbi:MAG TPA: hypothetical protein PLM48_05650 [Clostridia bacterium]|jgi:hypothetical protein|nr:hypothetical protein [Clostridia bacterium]